MQGRQACLVRVVGGEVGVVGVLERRQACLVRVVGREIGVVGSLRGDLVIKGFNSGTAGINALKAHIDRMALQGKEPDVIIVDYADLLKGSAKEKRYEVCGYRDWETDRKSVV